MSVAASPIPADALCLALDGLGLGYAWFDPALELVCSNDAFRRHYEFPPELLAGQPPLAKLLHFRAARGDCGADDPQQWVAALLARYRESGASVVEQRTLGTRALRVALQPVAPDGVIELSVDISAALHNEQALRQAEERFDHAMRAINEGVYDWGLGDGTVYYSARVRAALGLSPEELRTQADWGDRIHPDDLPRFRDAYVAHVKGVTERFECDYRYRAADGSWRWARQHGLALRDAAGRACRLIGSTGDITRLKEAELEVARAHEALEAHNRRLRAEIEAHRRSRATIEYLVDEIRGGQGIGKLVGQSPALLHLLRQMELVAETDATVLILGETGTGKELVARSVHELSARKAKPLVKLNCAALPRDLIESELFGHEKGAFTGATQLRRGRFELADGGSLFLDEVGELPPEAQAKLLRVLQEQEFERVGGGRTLRTDVRVIAATNRDLGERVRAGVFRSDLYYRLAVFPLHIPPLRERREDIPLLIRHFLTRIAERNGRPVAQVTDDFIVQAQRHEWPGNIRELENAVERAAILAQGGDLCLGEPLAAEPAAALAATVGPGTAQPLAEVERAHIRRTLGMTAGIIEGPRGAARLLGLKPSTLRARMRKLGIGRPSRMAH